MKFIKIVFPSNKTKSSGIYLINDKPFENIKQIVHQDIITSECIGNLARRRYHQLNGVSFPSYHELKLLSLVVRIGIRFVL